MANSLGNFSFISFTNPRTPRGSPHHVVMDNQILQRDGVNGAAVRRMGVKGFEFEMVSGVDALDFGTAEDLFASYTLLTQAGLQNIIWRNIDFSFFYGTGFIVVSVTEPSVTPISVAVGGLNSDPKAFLRARWTLLPVLVESGEVT